MRAEASAYRKRLTQMAPRIAISSLAALIGVQTFHDVRSIWLAARAARRVPGEHSAAARSVVRPPSEFRELAARVSAAHLFGTSPAIADDRRAPALAASMTLLLTGTLATRDPDRGLAIIATKDGRSALYGVGDPVADGRRLGHVFRDYVLLTYQGKFERLALPHQASSGPLPVDRAALIAARRRSSAAPEPAPPGTINPQAAYSLKAFGFDVLKDSSGAVSGISGGRIPMWNAAGLQPTDVVVAIDGQPMSQVVASPNAIDNASMAAVTTLTVLRDGAPMDIEAKPEPAVHSVRRRPTT